MNKPIAIHKLSAQTGLTSRTLRHWESEGLFESTRDEDSGWRVYDETAVLSIRITALLRRLDIPISEIRNVMKRKTFGKLREAILNRLSDLKALKDERIKKTRLLTEFLNFIREDDNKPISDADLRNFLLAFEKASDPEYETEDIIMTDPSKKENLRFIRLPPMRVVYNIAISVSPEEEAIRPVLAWLKSEGLEGTARLFGGNMEPMPSEDGKPYGYGMCASIPEDTVIPDSLKEMRLPGGLYAMLESGDDIGESWNTLMKLISENDKYEPDSSRLCFEEHIRSDSLEGSGSMYYLNLLEPVKNR